MLITQSLKKHALRLSKLNTELKNEQKQIRNFGTRAPASLGDQQAIAGDAILINQLYDSRLQTLRDQLGLQQAQNAERLKAIQGLRRDVLRVNLERENAAAV